MRSNLRRTALASVFAVATVAGGALPSASAQVTRCTDAAGKVSYTDKQCPASTRQARQLEGIDTHGTSIPVPGAKAPASGGTGSATVPPASAAAPVRTEIPSDGGLVVIDPRMRPPRQDPPDRTVANDSGYPYAYPDPYGYPYAGYPNAYRRGPNPPRDLGPTLRNCDAAGCSDTMGNHYDRAGRVDRYVRPDGRTCRPIGTTVVC